MMVQQPIDPTKGYKIIILVLAVLVVIVSVLFWTNITALKEANLVLSDEKISLTEELTIAVEDLNDIQTDNEVISRSLDAQRYKADSLLKALSNEKRFSRSKIRRYEQELGTLRAVMKKHVGQIDSLNTANRILITQNATLNTNLRRASLRAEAAEEQTKELTSKLRKGSQISVRDVDLLVSRKPDGKMVKVKRAKVMRIDFALSSNAIAMPGEREVFCRVTTPEGYPLSESSDSLFSFEGERLTFTASRNVDYQNSDLKVSLYYDCENLKAGQYTVELFMDQDIINTSKINLE